MTDSLRIRALRLMARVGATEEERSAAQPVLVDVDVSADLSRAGHSDELKDTVDYARVLQRVQDVVEGRPFALLEHIAESIAEAVSGMAPGAGVSVEIGKEKPPVPQEVASVSVRIERPQR
jgi:dihydroneopterin aldolase